jgi:hypothetical protein
MQPQVVVSVVDSARAIAQRDRLAKEITDHGVRVATAVFATNLSVNIVETPGLLKTWKKNGFRSYLLVHIWQKTPKVL